MDRDEMVGEILAGNAAWMDLRGVNLHGADLRGAWLHKADLDGADLTGTNLRGAILHKADLSGAILHGADLNRANLRGADLSKANLRGADLSKANLHKANLHKANLHGAHLLGAGLSGTDLRGARGLPVIRVKGIDQRILDRIEAGGELDMRDWHTCETTHCRAGWAIVLAGKAGAGLEALVGPCAAGALIYAASRPHRRVPDFYALTEAALWSIRRDAAPHGRNP